MSMGRAMQWITWCICSDHPCLSLLLTGGGIFCYASKDLACIVLQCIQRCMRPCYWRRLPAVLQGQAVLTHKEGFC